MDMTEIREGYKETEIGIIPEDWEVKKLGSLSEYRRGSFPQPYGRPEWYDNVNGMPFVQVYDVANNYKLKNQTKNKISDKAKDKSVYVPKGTLIITLQGTLGRAAITQYDAYIDRTLLIFTKIKSSVLIRYFMYSLEQLFDIEKKKADGGVIKTITKKTLTDFKIPVPPLKEQEKIAEILSTADKHIEDLDRLIEDYELLKKGMMQKLLTEGIGHTEFKDTEIGRIPNGWEVKALEEIANKKIKNSFIDGDWIEKEHLREDGIRLIQTGNIGIGEFVEKEDKKYISEESFRSLNCKEVFKDDILICRMAEPTGRSCIAPDLNKRMITSVDCVILRLDTKIHQLKFVNYFLNSYQGLKYSRLNEQGTTRRRITRKKLSKLPVPIPPLAEQEKMASILSSIDDHINQLKESKDNYTNLKQALMDRLLTGEIRVV